MIQKIVKQSSVVGLDIGRESIKVAQLTICDKRFRMDGVTSLGRTSIGHGLSGSEAERLSCVMNRKGMSAKRAVLIAPTEALVGGSISVPPADTNVSRHKIVEMEMSRAHRLTPGSFELAWWDLPVPASGTRIGQAHALGLPHDAVESTLEAIAEIGLHVVRTVPTSLALMAAAQRHPIDPRRISAVLDLASTRGHLSLMYAGRVVHERDLPDFNLTKLRDGIVSTLGIDNKIAKQAISRYGVLEEPDGVVACETNSLLAEAIQPLMEEIAMSFAYVSHLYPEADLGKMLLAGGGANMAGLSEALSTALELDVDVIRPDQLVQGDSFCQQSPDPALTAAVGAAICGEGY